MNPEYVIINLIVLLVLFLSSLLLIASYVLNYQDSHFVKLSSYECGFLPFDDARGAFNIEFYSVGILFVIFDLEIVFIFPLCVSIDLLTGIGQVVVITFLIILTVGFIYEWLKGGLDW